MKKLNLLNPAALGAFLTGDLDNALVASTPGGIEAQEAAGQRELVSNFVKLPTDFGSYEGVAGKDILERIGFKIGAPFDDIFTTVTPPAGWTLRATEHSMHSEILDEKGRVRMGMFYKAAFYDRHAHLRIQRRFNVASDYNTPEDIPRDKWTVVYHVVDGNSGARIFSADPDKYAGGLDAGNNACVAKLNELFPDWKNVEAYWD